MNSYERVFNRLQGKPVDRLPNLNIVMMFAAKQLGIPYGEYVTNYKKLVDGVMLCYEKYGIDAFCVISDPMREAEGLGCEVTVPTDDVPYATNHLITDISKISTIKAIDPSKGRRMNDRLEAIRLLSEKASKQVPVIGWVEGAIAESCDLMDMSQFMMELYDNPRGISNLLEVCYEQSRLFALAQINAGADIIGIGDAASSLLSPALFEEFALPYQIKLTRDIHNADAKVKLHICGNISPMLPLIAKVKADIVDCDHMVNLQYAADILSGISSVSGNFDPVSVLLQGSPKNIKAAVEKCCEIISLTTIISAGCEVPKMTASENLLAVKEALA